MFTESYASAMHWLTNGRQPWLGEVDLRTGEAPAQLWISSLAAFWPGLQVSNTRSVLCKSSLPGGFYAWSSSSWSCRHTFAAGSSLLPPCRVRAVGMQAYGIVISSAPQQTAGA